jgi:5-methylcytosine-specific restriction endonuclease McrA
VLARDGERCAFVSDRGHRCEATAFLELDHIAPRALGGKTTPQNIRLLCRAHNLYMARKELGPLFARERRAAYRAGSGASRAGARSAARRASAQRPRRCDES